MLKRLFQGLMITFSLSIFFNAHALNLGGVTQRAAGKAASVVTEQEYNKRLAKFQCQCNAANNEVVKNSACNIDKIAAEFTGIRTGLENSGAASDVDIIADSYGYNMKEANECANTVLRELKARGLPNWDHRVLAHSSSSRREVKFQININ